MSNRTTVLTIDAQHIADLRRLVDLLAAIQVAWPTARATFGKNVITITVATSVSGALAA